ncbi:MAG: hypothetical protein HRF50_06885 [Phycisphaerae bacterium]|jgi:hypothetical protein
MSWAAIGVLAALLPLGCDRARPPHEYSVIVGTVESLTTANGDLTVRFTRETGTQADAPIVHCQVTRDSEVYIDDRFSALDEIRVGDAIEVVGYRDANPRIDPFVVTFAYVDRTLPAPPEPPIPLTPARPAALPGGP